MGDFSDAGREPDFDVSFSFGVGDTVVRPLLQLNLHHPIVAFLTLPEEQCVDPPGRIRKLVLYDDLVVVEASNLERILQEIERLLPRPYFTPAGGRW